MELYQEKVQMELCQRKGAYRDGKGENRTLSARRCGLKYLVEGTTISLKVVVEVHQPQCESRECSVRMCCQS